MTNGQPNLNDIYEKLGRIEGKLDGLQCSVHLRRLEKLEETVGKRNLIAGVISASVAAVVLAIKYIAGR
jgi:hypothetical protein